MNGEVADDNNEQSNHCCCVESKLCSVCTVSRRTQRVRQV
jgi:hypothetical protein